MPFSFENIFTAISTEKASLFVKNLRSRKLPFSPFYPCKFPILTPFFPSKNLPKRPPKSLPNSSKSSNSPFKTLWIPSFGEKIPLFPYRDLFLSLKNFVFGLKNPLLPYIRPKPLSVKPLTTSPHMTCAQD